MASELPVYEYEVGGIVHTAQMDEDDAEKFGAVRAKAQAPATKAKASPSNKAGQVPQGKASTQTTPPAV